MSSRQSINWRGLPFRHSRDARWLSFWPSRNWWGAYTRRLQYGWALQIRHCRGWRGLHAQRGWSGYLSGERVGAW